MLAGSRLGDVGELVVSQRVPHRSQQSYRHEALLWHDRDDFTGNLVPFVDEGLELGEPVLVALTNEHTHWLRAALGEPAADRVCSSSTWSG